MLTKAAPDVYEMLKCNILQENDGMNFLRRVKEVIMSCKVNRRKMSRYFAADNFLELLLKMLNWNVLSNREEMFADIHEIISELSVKCPEVMARLLELDIDMKFIDLMEQEEETGKFVGVTLDGFILTLPHLICHFIPRVPISGCYDEVKMVDDHLLQNGFSLEYGKPQMQQLTTKIITDLFPTVFRLCQKPSYLKHYQYHVLLLKMTHWIREDRNLGDLLESNDKLVSYLKMTLNSCCIPAIVAMEVINILLKNDVNKTMYLYKAGLQSELLLIGTVEVLTNDSFLTSIKRMASDLVINFSNQITRYRCEIPVDCKVESEDETKPIIDLLQNIKEGKDDSEAEQSKIIDDIFKFIMVNLMNNESSTSLHERYARLRTFIGIVLNVRNDAKYQPGKLEVESHGIDMFRDVVVYILRFIERRNLKALTGYFLDIMDGNILFNEPKSPSEIDLGLHHCPALSRVLGESHNPILLSAMTFMKALRLMSIFYAVNEYWGVLFQNHTTDKLLPVSTFINAPLEKILSDIFKRNSYEMLGLIVDLAKQYPFLISFEMRMSILAVRKMKYFNNMRYELYSQENESLVTSLYYRISRKNLISEVIRQFDAYPKPVWQISFENEVGSGVGPTKEFFSLFSHECYRHKLNLWNGESYTSSDGLSYIHSPTGLFPSPCLNLPKKSCARLTAIGRVMAKSVLDSRQMNIHFSKATFAALLNPNIQMLTLSDLKHVSPSINSFVEKLVDVLKLKWKINEDDSLTSEEKSKSIADLKFDGCSFEDLYVNFTLPGFPDIEMMEGGRDINLSSENIEEYLKLLVWWFLYKGPQDKLLCLKRAFNSFFPLSYFKMFGSEEFSNIFRGQTHEPWTVDMLRKSFRFTKLSILEMPVIDYLFQVLSSFTPKEQEEFLQFTTSSSTLPLGGFENLEPKLTIDLMHVEGEPDDYMPISMTCVNLLQILPYSSPEKLRKKFLQAFEYGKGDFQLA